MTRPQYAILETTLIEKPDFNDLDKLTRQIEEKLVLVTNEILQDIKKSKLN
ncbi:hypothetical protein WFZ86_19755 [Flavobacterium sp. N6]